MNYNIFDMTMVIMSIFISYLGFWINYYAKRSTVLVEESPSVTKGSEASTIDYVEIPKSYFSHVYTYAYLLSWFSLIYMNLVYFLSINVSRVVRAFFELVMKNQRPVPVIAAIGSMLMLTIQCSRRLHETLFLQVFAKATKMNVCHFVLAVAHYTICILAVVGSSPLFCGSTNRKHIIWCDAASLLALLPSAILFTWASYEQHHSNQILVRHHSHLNSTNIITEDYVMPRGRLFDVVSSPHRLTEVVIYMAVALMMRTRTYFLIFIWVLSNQVQSSIGTHNWYKETFKNYRTRYALIPWMI